MFLRKLLLLIAFSILSAIASASPDTPSCQEYWPAHSGCWTASSRPSSYSIDYVVVHKAEIATASGTASWFQNPACGVSAHYCVDRNSGYCYQSVLEKDIAWHAGDWFYNCHSVGIEHSGYGANNDLTYACYAASAAITRSCIVYYTVGYDRSHLLEHRQVSATACPGNYFNWSVYLPLCNPVQVRNPSYFFDSDTNGWTAGNGSSGLNWNGSSWPGVAYADQTGNDMYWYSPATSYAAQAEPSFNIQVYPQSGNSPSHDMQMFWKTNASNGLDAAKSSQLVTYSRQNAWISLNLDCNKSGYWGQTINQLRLDFDNTSKGARFIVNHVYMQSTPRYWFGSGIEGWTRGNAMTSPWWTNSGWPGIMVSDQQGNDGWLYSPQMSFLSAENDLLNVNVFVQNGTTTHDMKVYFITSDDTAWNEAKSAPAITYTGNNAWKLVQFRMGKVATWPGRFIKQLRLDVDQTNHGNRFIFDYIKLDHSSAN